MVLWMGQLVCASDSLNGREGLESSPRDRGFGEQIAGSTGPS